MMKRTLQRKKPVLEEGENELTVVAENYILEKRQMVAVILFNVLSFLSCNSARLTLLSFNKRKKINHHNCLRQGR